MCKLSESKRLRALRAYQTYLNAVKLSHEQSFLQEDIEVGCSIQELQLSRNLEIEIVEDIILDLQRTRH
jgi:hypothetical protein